MVLLYLPIASFLPIWIKVSMQSIRLYFLLLASRQDRDQDNHAF